MLSAAGFLRRYDGLRTQLPGDDAPRARAAEDLRAHGLPGPRDEAWKYTSLRGLAAIGFHEALTEAGDHPGPVALPHLGALAEHPRLVFVGGKFRADLSVLPASVTVERFAGAAPAAEAAPGAIRTLNTLLAEDGAQLHVPAGQDAGTLLLISIGTGTQGVAASFHPRHHVVLAAGAALTLVEIAGGHGVYLHNPVTDIVLAEGARLGHVRLQIESARAYHLAAIGVDIAAGATYDGFTLTLGGALARCEINAKLSGPGAHAALNAAQVLRDRQHGDFTTLVRHVAPG